MSLELKRIIKTPSEISYDYATIKITQSRIDKGLLAIPVGLASIFPEQNRDIEVYLNDSPVAKLKHFSSYNSSTRECRIGGLKEWFIHHNIERGDEIVVQLIDKEHFIYRLIPENKFINSTKALQDEFDNSKSEEEASNKVQKISKWILSDEKEVIFNEFQRLTNIPLPERRQYNARKSVKARENIPPSIRNLLYKIYKGHCQICNFWFLKKDDLPYFEIHHLEPTLGHHPKNILVVCGNCHNQFEYASIREIRNDDNWLIQVFFNKNMHLVKQIIPSRKKTKFTKKTFV